MLDSSTLRLSTPLVPVSPELLGRGITVALDDLRRRARSSFAGFAPVCMRDNFGRPIVMATLHRVMHLHIEFCWQAGVHPALLAPWAHGKTIQCVVGRAAYELGHDPGLRIKIISNNDSRARERVMGIAALISSPAYRLVFPDIRRVATEDARRYGTQNRWTQHQIYIDRPGSALDPSVHGTGIISGGVGGRSDFNIFDDVCDQANALDKPAMRVKVIDNFDNTWMSRLESWGRALYLGTPWHEADLTHDLQKRPAWCMLKIAVSEDFKRLEMEVYNPPAGYPLPRMERTLRRRWVPVVSTNLRAVAYEPRRRELDIEFLSGDRYRYREVPRDVYDQLMAAGSKGAFVAKFIRGLYAVEQLA